MRTVVEAETYAGHRRLTTKTKKKSGRRACTGTGVSSATCVWWMRFDVLVLRVLEKSECNWKSRFRLRAPILLR